MIARSDVDLRRTPGSTATMSFQSIIRWLVPREDHFYDFLEAQADEAYEAALALRGFKEGVHANVVHVTVQELEHKGDKLSHEMGEALAKTFVTPIDREDLHRLSTELDDILDLANGAIRAATLYGVPTSTTPMTSLIEVLVACTLVVKQTTPLLRESRYAEITEAFHAIKKLEKDGDAIFRAAMTTIFSVETLEARKLLREKQVLEDLENAIDACERLGGTLAYLAVKHG